MDKKTLRYFQEKTHKGNFLSDTIEKLDSAIRHLNDFPLTQINFVVGEGNSQEIIKYFGNSADFKAFLENWKKDVEEQFENL